MVIVKYKLYPRINTYHNFSQNIWPNHKEKMIKACHLTMKSSVKMEKFHGKANFSFQIIGKHQKKSEHTLYHT